MGAPGFVVHYSKTNIKGDISRFLRNCEDFISNQLFMENPVVILTIFHKTFHILFIWNVKRTFLAVKLLVFFLFGCHGISNTVHFSKNEHTLDNLF